MTPGWLLDIFAAIMVAVAAVSAIRLAARRWHLAGRGVCDDVPCWDEDAAHLLTGTAMAGMLTASLTSLPAGAWEPVFGALLAWFAWRVRHDVRSRGARALASCPSGPHLVHAAAMLYMSLALTAPAAAGRGSGMTGMAGPVQSLRLPALALVFALLLAGYTVRDLDLLSSASSGAAGRYPRVRPGLATASAAAGSPPAASYSPGPAATGSGQVMAARPGRQAPEARVSGDGAPARALAAARGRVLAPGVVTGCRVATGLTMAFMIIIKI